MTEKEAKPEKPISQRLREKIATGWQRLAGAGVVPLEKAQEMAEAGVPVPIMGGSTGGEIDESLKGVPPEVTQKAMSLGRKLDAAIIGENTKQISEILKGMGRLVDKDSRLETWYNLKREEALGTVKPGEPTRIGKERERREQRKKEQPPSPPERRKGAKPPEEPPRPPGQPPENILSSEGGPIKPGKYVLTRETARQILSSPDYFLFSRREQAAVRRVAEVASARSQLFAGPSRRELQFNLSDFRDRYRAQIEEAKKEGVAEEVKGKLAVPDEEREEAAIEFVRTRFKTPEELVGAIYEVLMQGLYDRDFPVGVHSFFTHALARLGREDRKTHQSLSRLKNACVGAVDLWHEGIKGESGTGKTMAGLIAHGTEYLTPDLIHFLSTDPSLEIHYHNASTRLPADLDNEEEVILDKKPSGKITCEARAKIGPDGRPVLREIDEVAWDILADILHQETLKVRYDHRQAPVDTYIVYKTDQPGVQLGEGKYNHTEFRRLLRRKSIFNYETGRWETRVELIWNNGMPSLWTQATQEALANKWLHLITAGDSPYHDERGLAWLISFSGEEIDRRLHGYEALDFDGWLAISDPTRKKEILDIYLKLFREDIEAGGERAARAIHALKANLSRMRTEWQTAISVKDGRGVDMGRHQFPGAPKGIPVNVQGFDLDAVWFNPETKQWEFCLNYRWFFQSPDNEGGSVLGNDISNLATYEGYKQAFYDNGEMGVYHLTKARAFKDFNERPKSIDYLLGEDTARQHYCVPEYRELIASYLINAVQEQEMTAGLYVERYRGRALNFLKGAKEKTFYLEWALNQELHFDSCGIDSRWSQAQNTELQAATPGKRLRMIMQENSHIGVWENFTRRNKIDLETLLTFMGVRRLSPAEIADLQAAGNLPAEIPADILNQYLLLDYLNLRKLKHPISGEEAFFYDRFHDNIDEGEWAKRIIVLLKRDGSLVEKLSTLGKLVSPRENGEWALKIADLLTAGESVAPEDQVLADALRRYQRKIPIGEGSDWIFLNPWHPMRLARKLNWEREADTELYPDYDLAVQKGKASNWIDVGAGVMAVDFLQARKRVNKRTWQHLVPLGEYRGHHLFRQWNDNEASPDYGKPLEEPYNQGISLIRNLWGGWWTYQPETGLQERPPFYVEMDLVAFEASLLNPPYRMETAQRLADAGYSEIKKALGQPEVILDEDRRTSGWQALFRARRREEMIVAPGPDWWEAELAVLGFLGLLGVEGKMTIDERPKNEFARWLGIETLRRPDGSGAQKYRDYLVNHLNIRRFVPEITNPEQLERVTKTLREQQARLVEDLKKYTTLAPEGLELAAFVGFSLPELAQQYGESPIDNAPQVTNALGFAAIPYILYWGPVLAGAIFPLPLTSLAISNIVAPLALARLGYLYGTDVGEESDIHRVPLIKILRWETLKVPASLIVKVQKNFWKYNPLRFLVGGLAKPIAVKREEELEGGRGHDTLIKTGHAAAWIDMWKDKFGD